MRSAHRFVYLQRSDLPANVGSFMSNKWRHHLWRVLAGIGLDASSIRSNQPAVLWFLEFAIIVFNEELLFAMAVLVSFRF